jgi:O-antigen/teichoic acid export membrane protein
LMLIVAFECIHWHITGRFFIWPEKDMLLGICGILFFFSLLITERYFAFYNGTNQLKWYNLQLAIFSFLSLIPLFYWIIQPDWPEQNQVILIIILVSVLQMLILAFVFYWLPNTGYTARDNEPGGGNRFFTYSMLAYLANSIQFLVYRIDFWILHYFHGESELGLYALSVRIGQTLWILPGLLATVILPHVTLVTFDKSLLERMLRLTNTFNLLASVIMGLLSFILVPFIFGQAFSGSIIPLLIMIPGLLFVSVHTIIAAYFAGKNKIANNLKVSALTLITIVVLDLLLIPSMGKTGAAIACTIAYSIGGIYIMKLYADLENYSLFRIFVNKNDIDWLRYKINLILTERNYF